MALKSKYTSVDALKADLTKVFKEASSSKNMKAIGSQAAEIIRRRTRLGYGVEKNEGKRERLKPLSPKYIEKRKQNTLSSQTTPRRSNLTFTGELLDSIEAHDATQGEVQVGPRGARSDGGPDNEKLAEYVRDAGRPFNNLSATEIKQLTQFFEEIIEKLIK